MKNKLKWRKKPYYSIWKCKRFAIKENKSQSLFYLYDLNDGPDSDYIGAENTLKEAKNRAERLVALDLLARQAQKLKLGY